MLANLGGVVPPGFAVMLIEEATELFDLELSPDLSQVPGSILDGGAFGGDGQVLQEGAQEARRAELDGEAQPVVAATMRANQSPVAVIQVKVAGQLLRRRSPTKRP